MLQALCGRFFVPYTGQLMVEDRTFAKIGEANRDGFHRDTALCCQSPFCLSNEQVLYFGSNNAIRITGKAFQGSKQFEVTVPHTQVPVTDTERDSLIANTSQEFRALLRGRLPKKSWPSRR